MLPSSNVGGPIWGEYYSSFVEVGLVGLGFRLLVPKVQEICIKVTHEGSAWSPHNPFWERCKEFIPRFRSSSWSEVAVNDVMGGTRWVDDLSQYGMSWDEHMAAMLRESESRRQDGDDPA